jgi:peptide/nickel transport system substrate-binding protein
MFSHKRLTIALGLAVVLSMVLAACGGGGAVQTIIVAGTPQVIEVTPTVAPVSFNSADPTTLTVATIGEPDSLDPAWDYETAGGEILENTYDTLVWYNRGSAIDFVPQLATDWTISEDGMTYTFTIRQGVTFHNGDPMTAADVAWTFQRGVLQGGYNSPQWLLTEPFFGIGTYDIAELVDPAVADDPAALAASDPAALLAACQRATSAIVDNGDGTVSFHLAQPWGPFIPTLAQFWGSVQDKAWAIEQGAWDGDCATWQNFYGRDSESAPLTAIENGTGPFMLDHWTHGQEIVMVRNPNYWRTAEVGPAWEGAPTGNAALERVVILSVDEWGTRFAMLQAGDADFAVVDRSNVSQVDPLVGERCDWNADTADFTCAPTDNPNGPLRLFIGHPSSTRQDAFFTFDINVEGGNTFVGSGALDGNGIPADFFSDIHVRKAFEYCFDWDTYIADVLNGEGIQNVGYLVPGMIGYDQNGPHYSYDLEACRAEIEQAWDGQVAANGFRLQAAYNIGNTSRQTMAEMLQAAFQDPVVDPDATGKYLVEVVGLPWPSLLASIRASRTPIFISGWIEDIHDPHNWAGAMLTSTYASRQRMPQAMRDAFQALVNAGVAATDPAERAVIYQQLTQMDYDNAIAIRLAVATGRHYEQRWVQGWFYNPIYAGFYYYVLSKQ